MRKGMCMILITIIGQCLMDIRYRLSSSLCCSTTSCVRRCSGGCVTGGTSSSTRFGSSDCGSADHDHYLDKVMTVVTTRIRRCRTTSTSTGSGRYHYRNRIGRK